MNPFNLNTPADAVKHQILVIGGGTAGLTVAAQLKKKQPDADIAILEPSDHHYYQPAWTLVGGGTYELEDTIREEKDYIPKGTLWIQDAVEEIHPEEQLIITRDGRKLMYEYLVVAAGIQLNWNDIPGLAESVGTKGVCSNYHWKYAPYTYEVIKNFKGGNALFTQPATPIKCGGAPQKIMYLAEDYFRKHGVRNDTNVIFATPGSVIFGVKEFAATLNRIIQERDIYTRFFHKLVEIRPDRKEAVYEVTNADSGCVLVEDKFSGMNLTVEGTSRVVVPFDMLHTAPPQSAPDFIRNSAISDGSAFGGVDVDKLTLQHKKYANVFALGDVANTPNAKTGAAVRKQAPVVVDNLVSVMEHEKMHGSYNGYSSCPIVTGYGKMLLAEFDYDNHVDSSFFFDTTKERTSMWYLKKYFLPWMYWNRMLKGNG